MNLGLTDRVALIGGSSRGIGLATARAFLEEGSRVLLTGRDPEALAQAERDLGPRYGTDRVMTRAGDAGDAANAAAIVEAVRACWSAPDCVVANVGSGTAKAGWQLGEADWQAAFEVNFGASRRLVEAALPAMVAAGRGSIVFTASIVGLESLDAPLTYSAAKAALVSYAKNLARQLAPSGVRVNAVAPGNVLVPGGSWDRKLAERPEAVRGYIDREVPMKRFGTAEEIASVIVFLASERASFVTGACIVADGGQTRSYVA